MTAARRLKGLDALRDATVETTTGIPILNVDGAPRGALTVAETAAFLGLTPTGGPVWIRARIRAGRIPVISEGLRDYLIPISGVLKILEWAGNENIA